MSANHVITDPNRLGRDKTRPVQRKAGKKPLLRIRRLVLEKFLPATWFDDGAKREYAVKAYILEMR